MTPLLFVVAAALGAVVRFTTARVVCSWQALLVVNTAGSALLGWLVSHDIGSATLLIVGTGFCGALTTYSSFALEVRRLGIRMGVVYVASTLVCATGAASLATTF